MAFKNLNSVQRIAVIDEDMDILENDIEVFYSYLSKKPSFTVFLSTIIRNYISEAQCSFINDANNIKETIYNELNWLSDKDKSKIFNKLQNLYIKSRIQDFKNLFKNSTKIADNRVSFTNALQENIYNLECSKYYDGDIKTYLRFLIHEYTTLSLGKRERIIFKELIEKVNNAIKNSNVIMVKSFDDSDKYIVRPIGITEDSQTQFNYLCGYAKKQNAEIESYKSFRIYRIETIIQLSDKYTMTEKENKFRESPAYYDTKNKYTVKLTNKGYSMYQGILHLRPTSTSVESKNGYYILNFYSSEREMYNYFFKFGAECQIIEPVSLHKRFTEEYKKALAIYDDMYNLENT